MSRTHTLSHFGARSIENVRTSMYICRAVVGRRRASSVQRLTQEEAVPKSRPVRASVVQGMSLHHLRH